jgi:DNA-binding XRE family transcriptional regulator
MSKAQIIYDDAGAPAFVVIPYARFRDIAPEAAEAALSDETLFDLAMAEKNAATAVPHEVMVRLIDGENPVKVYREWRGLTQADLAARAGVTVGFISQVERGARNLSRKSRAAIATVLGVLPVDLDVDE